VYDAPQQLVVRLQQQSTCTRNDTAQIISQLLITDRVVLNTIQAGTKSALQTTACALQSAASLNTEVHGQNLQLQL
jgi:hypothetical protein